METEIRFELLNRFDRIVHFKPLSRNEIRTVAMRELRRIETRIGMNQHGLTLALDRSIVDWIADRGYDPDHGARMLRRTVASEVVTAVADVIVGERPEAGSRIVLRIVNDKIHACISTASVSDTATAWPIGRMDGAPTRFFLRARIASRPST